MTPYGEVIQLGENERRDWVPPRWIWVPAGLALFGVAAAGVLATPPGNAVAVWWPAAGLSVLFALLNPGRRRWAVVALVLVATGLGNFVAGRPPLMSAAFGLSNAAEVAVVATFLARGPGRFRLRSSWDAARFVLACSAGAVTVALMAGVSAAVLRGSDFGAVFVHAGVSHAAAVMLVAPLGALPGPQRARVHLGELIAQSTLLAASVFVVFAPAAYLALSFIPFAMVVWGAVRFPAPVVLTETLLTGVAILTLVRAQQAVPTAMPLSAEERALFAGAFVIGLCVVALVLVSARTETRSALRTANHFTRLLEGGFVDMQVGLLIAERRSDSVRVLWANRAALTTLGDEIGSSGLWSGPVADLAVAAAMDSAYATYQAPTSGDTISIVANHVPNDVGRFVVQFVDITRPVRTTEAMLAAERERTAALAARLELERQREEFLATTSHELRTPITSILGYVELLADSPTLSAREREWVDVLERNAGRLAYLVDDVLTLATLDGDAQAPSPRLLSAREVIDEVIAMYRPIAAAHDISLGMDSAPRHAVWCDPNDLGRILGNLVSNALKFTPPGGEITVISDSDGWRTSIAVEDTGPGMQPLTLAHAFDRFYRGRDPHAQDAPGTGLGLAIVAELAKRNAGTATLANRPSEGLRAAVVLPATGSHSDS